MRLTKQQRACQEELARALDTAEAAMEVGLTHAQDAVDAALRSLAELVVRLNGARVRAAKFAEEVADEAQGELEEKSERWQESERGEALREFAEEWREVASDMDRQCEVPRLPRIELDDELDGSERLKSAPQEVE